MFSLTESASAMVGFVPQVQLGGASSEFALPNGGRTGSKLPSYNVGRG